MVNGELLDVVVAVGEAIVREPVAVGIQDGLLGLQDPAPDDPRLRARAGLAGISRWREENRPAHRV
jgi:hypothetical protein